MRYSNVKESCAYLFASLLCFSVSSFGANPNDPQASDLYEVKGTPEDLKKLGELGVDLSEANVRNDELGLAADAVLTGEQAKALSLKGVSVKLKLDKNGKSVGQASTLAAASGYNVFKHYDGPGGFLEIAKGLARNNRNLVKLVQYGTSVQGRPLVALKVTQDANTIPDGSRPAVLYDSLIHAREWITGEVNLRFLQNMINEFQAPNKIKDIKQMLKTRELWFILTVNPDGYEYTFTAGHRLWRKNMRDNNNDGLINAFDGVDLNRNAAASWGYDNEGSSPFVTSETYRGPSPASEPETSSLQNLILKIKPKFYNAQHSAAALILHGGSFPGILQADCPIETALAGINDNTAITGYKPGPSADELYATNGSTREFARNNGTISFTPEMSDAGTGFGFSFPDDETKIEAEYQINKPFMLSLARSATQPDNPVSSVGITAKPFYLDLDEIDPELGANANMDFRFQVSYGDPQKVRVLAKRSIGAVTLQYQINGGPIMSKSTAEPADGKRFGQGSNVYYHVIEGVVTGTNPGDSVKVWFKAGSNTSDSFTYQMANKTSNQVLVVAAEDYTGASGSAAASPLFLSYYTSALNANGIGYDIYDIDARGRVAPDNLGVLSHYKVVVYYTGNDIVTRNPGQGAGNAARLAIQEIEELQIFLNEGGKVFMSGKNAGLQWTEALGTQSYDPYFDRVCRPAGSTAPESFCRPLSGSGDNQNDGIEYYFGAAVSTGGGGSDPAGLLYPVIGTAYPFSSLALTFNGADSAQNQNGRRSGSFISTQQLNLLQSPIYNTLFDSPPIAVYDKGAVGGGATDPHSGTKMMSSQTADKAFKRLTRQLTIPADGATFSFWTSFQTELNWDYVFVEVHTVGLDDWTTLQDVDHFLTDDLSADESCTTGWSSLAYTDPIHLTLKRYQTRNDSAVPVTCDPTGTTGHWYAKSGNSSGWKKLTFDLLAYAGKTIEISISHATDWGTTPFLGVLIDDIQVSNGQGTNTSDAGSTSFEDDGDTLDGWTVPGAPTDPVLDPNNLEGDNLNDFVVAGGLGIIEAAVIKTANTIYMGFGLEGITGAANRADVMGRAVNYLLQQP